MILTFRENYYYECVAGRKNLKVVGEIKMKSLAGDFSVAWGSSHGEPSEVPEEIYQEHQTDPAKYDWQLEKYSKSPLIESKAPHCWCAWELPKRTPNCYVILQLWWYISSILSCFVGLVDGCGLPERFWWTFWIIVSSTSNLSLIQVMVSLIGGPVWNSLINCLCTLTAFSNFQ